MGRERNDASSPIADICQVWCRCDLCDCQQEYKHRLATVCSPGLSGIDHSSSHQYRPLHFSRSLDRHMENHAETSYSGRIHRYEHPQELDARCSTFNNPGRDQHNYYYTFVSDTHFHSRETSDVHDPAINKYVGSDDCQAAAIVGTTTFVTTNAAVAAPYLGILNCHSATLAVKIPSVRYTFFSD